jgi:hypothetical protein
MQEITTLISENFRNSISTNGSVESKLTGNPTHPPHPTQVTAIMTIEQPPSSAISKVVDMSDKIYRLGSTDNWACKNCKMRGDTWFMKKHLFKGITK